MYSLLIADDEPNVLNSLKNTIDWSKLQFKVIGTASDGIKAKELFMEKKPDVVMTDVVMPGMDGLDLVSNIQKSGIPVKFVILSAYDEFKYAQKAMSYGVREYLLKPFDDDEIFQVFRKIKNELDNGINSDIFVHENEQNSSTNDSLVSKAKKLIKQNISYDFSLVEIANELYVNHSYLSSIFKKETGMNFSEYVNFVKLERAKELLRASKYRVKDIALKVGFDNYAYFCRVFKKSEGITPLEFRAGLPAEGDL